MDEGIDMMGMFGFDEKLVFFVFGLGFRYFIYVKRTSRVGSRGSSYFT